MKAYLSNDVHLCLFRNFNEKLIKDLDFNFFLILLKRSCMFEYVPKSLLLFIKG